MMGMLQFEDQHPLVQAIFTGGLDEVRAILDSRPDINWLDFDKRSPLHAAAFKGDPGIASLLISCGARVNAKDSKWITPLHRACAVGAEKVVELLLQNEAIVSARDRQWQTPLHIAAANDAISCVELLLSYIPNINVTDRAGRTALHHAAANGHSNMVELLISRGAIVNACDKKDFRPLHYAAQMGHLDTVELLLGHGADVNAKDRNQCTPLHIAATTGNDLICRCLLAAGADVDAQNAYCNTPLHLACLNGHLTVCQELVSFDASLEAVNFRGQTPLHIAAASAHGVDCLMYLMMLDVDINKQSLDGRTPLHMTAIHGRFTRSKTLIDEGAIIDCKDKNECTPLHIAAQNGHDLLANTLLSYGANPMERGPEGRTPLHMCCLGGFVECCRKFLQVGVDLNALDNTGKTPIHCAAYKGSAECLDLLISNGANFVIADNMKRLPLHYAAAEGHYQCLFTLVGVGSPTNAADFEGCTPLHLASAYDMESKCVAYLLQHKADPLARNLKKFTPLHYAVSGGNTKAVDYLLKTPTGPSIFDQDDLPDVTPLHLAAKLGNVEILQNILSYYHRVNTQTEKGITPLMLAAREGHTECVRMLLRSGANVAICDKVHGMTPVHYSAKNGHFQCLSLLLHNSESLNVVDMLDKYERTALMLAVSGNHIECVQFLLKSGAQPNIFDKDKHSPLFRAVVNGQNSVVDLLLASNSVMNTQDVYGKTVFHLAAACGHLTCLQSLLDNAKDEDIMLLDNQRCSVLHWACYNGQWNCLECLLNKNVFKRLDGNEFSPVHCAAFAGSEMCLDLLISYFGSEIVHLKDSRQRTPLHIAGLHGHVQCAKYLIEKGALLEAVDEDGRTPLIAAAQYGQSQIVELLLTNKANKTATDKQGNTALHWACLKKHIYTALLILEYSGDTPIVNMANQDKKTPLHLAARNGLVEVVRELLRRGSSVFMVDKEGYTPALCCAPNNNVAQCLGLILQSLAELTNSSMENDPLSLKAFFDQTYSESSIKTTSSQMSQTDITLVHDPDLFEIKQFFKVKKVQSSTSKAKSTKSQDLKDKTLSEVDLFLIETNDFNSGYIPEPRNRPHGLNLHKSYSDMSIACKSNSMKPLKTMSPQKLLCDIVDKKKNCRECYRLQHRCTDCTLRYVLRLHIQGKTSHKSFNDFISKSLNEASPAYRQKLLQAVGAIRREYAEKTDISSLRRSTPRSFEKSKSFDSVIRPSHNLEKVTKKQTENAGSSEKKKVNELSEFDVSTQNFKNEAEQSFELKSNLDLNLDSSDSDIKILKSLSSMESHSLECSEHCDDGDERGSDCPDNTLTTGMKSDETINTNIPLEKLKCLQEAGQEVSEHIKEVSQILTRTIEEEEQKLKGSERKDEMEVMGNVSCENEAGKDIKENLNDEFLKYLKSVKLGYSKTRDEEYFKALSSYMSYMLQKFDRDFELQKELEQNYKSCAKYQEINRTMGKELASSLSRKIKRRQDLLHEDSRKTCQKSVDVCNEKTENVCKNADLIPPPNISDVIVDKEGSSVEEKSEIACKSSHETTSVALDLISELNIEDSTETPGGIRNEPECLFVTNENGDSTSLLNNNPPRSEENKIKAIDNIGDANDKTSSEEPSNVTKNISMVGHQHEHFIMKQVSDMGINADIIEHLEEIVSNVSEQSAQTSEDILLVSEKETETKVDTENDVSETRIVEDQIKDDENNEDATDLFPQDNDICETENAISEKEEEEEVKSIDGKNSLHKKWRIKDVSCAIS